MGSKDAYVELQLIGKGSQGTVTLVKDKERHVKYVIKKVPLFSLTDAEKRAVLQECNLLKDLRHANIVEYRESYIEEDERAPKMCIVMQYCEGGDLATHIKNQARVGEPYEETQILDWFSQIALAVAYIHDMRVLHRDLKTNNVFLTDKSIIKLGDFGIAKVLDTTLEQAETVIGTPYYMSPEVCENKPYSYKSDVWALGCILYEMCTLKHAFKASNLLGIVFKIVAEKAPPIPVIYSSDLVQLVEDMLQKKTAERLSIEQVLAAPIVQNHMHGLSSSGGGSVVGSLGRTVNKSPSFHRRRPSGDRGRHAPSMPSVDERPSSARKVVVAVEAARAQGKGPRSSGTGLSVSGPAASVKANGDRRRSSGSIQGGTDSPPAEAKGQHPRRSQTNASTNDSKAHRNSTTSNNNNGVNESGGNRARSLQNLLPKKSSHFSGGGGPAERKQSNSPQQPSTPGSEGGGGLGAWAKGYDVDVDGEVSLDSDSRHIYEVPPGYGVVSGAGAKATHAPKLGSSTGSHTGSGTYAYEANQISSLADGWADSDDAEEASYMHEERKTVRRRSKELVGVTDVDDRPITATGRYQWEEKLAAVAKQLPAARAQAAAATAPKNDPEQDEYSSDFDSDSSSRQDAGLQDERDNGHHHPSHLVLPKSSSRGGGLNSVILNDAVTKTPRESHVHDVRHARDMEEVLQNMREVSTGRKVYRSPITPAASSDMQSPYNSNNNINSSNHNPGSRSSSQHGTKSNSTAPGPGSQANARTMDKIRQRLSRELGPDLFSRVLNLVRDAHRRKEEVSKRTLLELVRGDKKLLPLCFEVDQLVYLESVAG